VLIFFITNGWHSLKQTDECLANYDFAVVCLEFVFVPLSDSGHCHTEASCTPGMQCTIQTCTKKEECTNLSWQAYSVKTVADKGLRVKMYQMILNLPVQLC